MSSSGQGLELFTLPGCSRRHKNKHNNSQQEIRTRSNQHRVRKPGVPTTSRDRIRSRIQGQGWKTRTGIRGWFSTWKSKHNKAKYSNRQGSTLFTEQSNTQMGCKLKIISCPFRWETAFAWSPPLEMKTHGGVVQWESALWSLFGQAIRTIKLVAFWLSAWHSSPSLS